MKSIKSGLVNKSLSLLMAMATFWTLSVSSIATAQRVETINAGTTITVRTNERINASEPDEQVFSGEVAEDVLNRRGNVAIPEGSDVELVVRRLSNDEVALDLESVTVNVRRYGVEADTSAVEAERRSGIGVNERTGKYVGGGAAIGAIIGAITGGGKGAAIGAGAGAAAGAGAQVLTRGKRVRIPAESLLTFRLAQPLRADAGNRYYTSNDRPYNDDRYYTSSERPYYDQGRSSARGSVDIGSDNNIRWNSTERYAKVFVEVDNEAPKLFASGTSGTQAAPWIERGHRYVFVLTDPNDREIARDTLDLRSYRRR
jgi:outer membrane lipoprotein SlyB